MTGLAGTLAPDETIELGRGVEILKSGSTLSVTGADREVDLSGSDRILSAIAAARRPVQISAAARHFDVDVDLLLQCLECLRQEGMLLRPSAEASARDVESYLAIFHDNCEVQASGVTLCPFWRTVTAGDADRGLIEGWGFEFFHFIDSSNEYMPLAVAQTGLSTSVRLRMAKHCVDESDHGRIFLRGLTDMSFPERAVRTSAPLPTTSALVNGLAELACAETLGYLATFGVMQQRRIRPGRAEYERFRDHLASAYPYAQPLFDALHRHSVIDDELDHDELVFDAVVRETGLPSERHRKVIMAATRRFAWSFEEFFSGILRWYGGGAVRAPRRPVTVDQFR